MSRNYRKQTLTYHLSQYKPYQNQRRIRLHKTQSKSKCYDFYGTTLTRTETTEVEEAEEAVVITEIVADMEVVADTEVVEDTVVTKTTEIENVVLRTTQVFTGV